MWGRCVFLGGVLVCLLGAQETRSVIAGKVLDQQATPIFGARVTVTNLETNTSVELTTNDTGYYEASLSLQGTYRITAQMEGFKRAIRSGVTLAVGAQLEIDLTLEVGDLSQSVTVTADAPVLETTNFSSGAVIDNKMLMDLPNMGNNPTLLAKLVPGMQSDGTNNYLGLHSIVGGSDYYVGGRVGGNDWTIDGVPNNGGSRRAAYLPYSDTVAEFRVETTMFDASTGRGTGASVTAITKSGANRVSGTLTEQHWQQRLNATPFFVKQLYYRNIAAAESAGDARLANDLRNSPKQPSGHSNNYAGTIGGPIYIPKIINGRNKLFFFFSYNGFKDVKTEDAANFNRTVPTMAQREGDFSQLLIADPVRYQLYDPFTIRVDPDRPTQGIRDPFPGNIIPKSRFINPGYKKYVSFLPVPNNDPLNPRLEPTNNYLAVGTPYNWDYWALSNRIDYHISGKHRLFSRWSWNNFVEDRGDWTYESARGLHSNGLRRKNRGATIDYTYARSSAMLLSGSVSINEYRDGSIRPVQMSYKPSDVGLPEYMDQWAGDQHILPYVNMSGYREISSSSVPTFTSFRTFSWRGDVNYIEGPRTWRAGFDSRQHFRTGGGGGNTSGNFRYDNRWTRKNSDSFTPAGSLGHSFAAFLMGLPYEASVSTSNENYAMHSPYYGGYMQNNWRMTPRLTVNLGMRAEYEIGGTERYNRVIGWFDPTLLVPPVTEASEAAYAAAPQDFLAASMFKVRGGTTFPGSGDYARQTIKSQLMVMPRASMAWSITKRLVYRMGYGMFYDTLNTLNQTPRQTGFTRTTTTQISTDWGRTWRAGDPVNGVSPLMDPFPIRSDGTRFNLAAKGAAGALSLAGRDFNDWYDFNTERARQHRWRAGFQFQLERDTRLELNYAGSYSNNNYVTRDLNYLPGEYYADGLVRRADVQSYLDGRVTNPFHLPTVFPDLRETNPVLWQELNSTTLFTDSRIARHRLLRPFPHMLSIEQSQSPVGIVHTNSFELSAMRRFSRALMFTFGYTRLFNKSRDWFANEFDPLPSWRPSNNGRPHRLIATGIYQLPFGRRRPLLKDGWIAKVVGGFQFAATYEWQPGPLLDWGNVFFYGDPNQIAADEQLIDRWFNIDAGFERVSNRQPASYHKRIFPNRIDGVRRDSTNVINANIQRDFRVTERTVFTLRADALNLANHSQFGTPEMSPNSTNFGRVTAQTAAVNRFLQFQLRLRF